MVDTGKIISKSCIITLNRIIISHKANFLKMNFQQNIVGCIIHVAFITTYLMLKWNSLALLNFIIRFMIRNVIYVRQKEVRLLLVISENQRLIKLKSRNFAKKCFMPNVEGELVYIWKTPLMRLLLIVLCSVVIISLTLLIRDSRSWIMTSLTRY